MKLFPQKEEKVLKQLLACAVEPDEALSLSGLHGFLYCLALIPEAIVPSEWFPYVFGDEMFELDDEEQANTLFGGLMAVYNRFMDQSNRGVLRFPFDMGKLKNAEIDQIREWAYGFFLGTGLRPEVWGLPDEEEDFPDMDDEEVTEDEEEIAACMMVLLGVAFPERIPELIDHEAEAMAEKEPPSPLEREADFLSMLPMAVETFQAIADEQRDIMYPDSPQHSAPPAPIRREEKIGRNDPCPCGSGKKYKKCCGLN